MGPMIRLPHPLALLTACVLLAAVATWVTPSGAYERVVDPDTGRTLVVGGSYEAVGSTPVGPFQALEALPRGMAAAGEIVFLVFLAGAAFVVVDETGTLRRVVGALVGGLGHRGPILLVALSLAFGTGGVLYNMHEEIVALVPVLLILSRRLGYSPVVALAVSIGAAVVGSAFSPMNPFQVGIAQQIAELPLLSGGGFRVVLLLLAMALWIGATLRFAAATRTDPGRLGADADTAPATRRDALVTAIVLGSFAFLVWGILAREWGFNTMSALFVLMGIAAGFAGGLGLDGTSKAFAKGFREMALAALLIGVARAVFVVMEDGHIVDTVVHAMVTPLEDLPRMASALGMMVAHTVIHIPVSSQTGQAVLTLPILVPLSDLLGISRQVAVLAYQMGSGLADMWIPTNGALLAMVAAAGVRYEEWLRFCVPIYVLLMLLGAVGIIVGVAVGW